MANGFCLTGPIIFGTGGGPTPSTPFQYEYASGSIAPTAGATILSFMPTTSIVLQGVYIAGDGDALVSITIDSANAGNAIINRGSPNVLVQFGVEVTGGLVIDVNITCNGIATSNYYVTLIYE